MSEPSAARSLMSESAWDGATSKAESAAMGHGTLPGHGLPTAAAARFAQHLKPGNLLLDSNDSIKITDFGLATIRVASTESRAGTDSPEDCRGHR